jgi:hypothetical protein
MTHENGPSERLLSRREILRYLGAAGAVWLMADSLNPSLSEAGTLGPSCVVRPEQMEGPYFVDERLNRSDIRSDPTDGRVKPGTPHCDAQGVYSDIQDPEFNTIGQKFLRGYQITDPRGEVRFVTVYPGWYPGRTVHIHFKIRTTPMAKQNFEFASQLYFDDGLTDRVHTARPYATSGPRTARNQHDWIFRRGGDRLMLAPTTVADGYAASFAVGLQLP